MSHVCDGRDLSCAGCAAHRAAAVRVGMTLDDQLDDIRRVQIWSKLASRLVEAPVRPVRWRARIAAATLAAAGIVIVVAALRSRAAPVQMFMAPGDTTLSLRLGPARASLIGPAQLVVLDGAADATSVRLSAGTMLAEFEGGHGRTLRITAPGATIEIVGTLFAVTVRGGATCVSVAHGTVRMTTATRSLAITGGQRACSDDQAVRALDPGTRDALARHAATITAERSGAPAAPSAPGEPIAAIASAPTALPAEPPAPAAPTVVPADVPPPAAPTIAQAAAEPPPTIAQPADEPAPTIAQPAPATPAADEPAPAAPTVTPSASEPASPPLRSQPSKPLRPKPAHRSRPRAPAAPPSAIIASRTSASASPVEPVPALPAPPAVVAPSPPATPAMPPAPASRSTTAAATPATSAPGADLPPPTTAASLYREAEAALAKRDLGAADRSLATLLAQFPETALLDQALYERARIAYRRRAWADAQRQLDRLSLVRGSPLHEPGAYLACRIAVEAGDGDAAGCLTGYRARYPSSPHDADALSLLVELAARAGGCAAAKPRIADLARSHPGAEATRSWQRRCPEAP